MKAKGFLVEHRTVERGAYYCYLKFPKILYKSGISPHASEKILIRIAMLDLNFLAKDVEPFLFSAEQKERVLTFREYWRQHQ